jgi:hypothetical protein
VETYAPRRCYVLRELQSTQVPKNLRELLGMKSGAATTDQSDDHPLFGTKGQ